MDTKKSQRIALNYMERGDKLKRKTQKFHHTWKAKKSDVFKLLCPTKEADWIPGWNADNTSIIYSKSGYAEDREVFKTSPENVTGEGVWIITKFNPTSEIALIKLMEDLIQYIKITLVDNNDGTITGIWESTHTALNERVNTIIEKMPDENLHTHNLFQMIQNYLGNPNAIESEKVLKKFKDRELKFERINEIFSGVWKTDLDQLFPLFCPAREADWIPGWDCEILYSDEKGYASDKCVFKTKSSNPVGEGLWTFTCYEKNKNIEFVCFQEDIIHHDRIMLNDNKDGTVTGIWDCTVTALTENGNKKVNKWNNFLKQEAKILPRMIDYYLKEGKTVDKLALALGRLHGLHTIHD